MTTRVDDQRATEWAVPELRPPGLVDWVQDTLIIAQRTLRHVVRSPDQLIMFVVQPIMFFILFMYVFGGAISLPGGADYRDFLLPGILTQTMVFGSEVSMGVGVAAERRSGLLERFQSLPMRRSAVLWGRSLVEILRNTFGLVVMFVVGFLFGWRPDGDLGQLIAGSVLLVGFGFALGWAVALVGLYATSVQGASALLMTTLLPFGFLSSAYVPTETMPGWLRVYADNSPVTQVADAARSLFAGQPDSQAIAGATIWILALFVIFAAWSSWKFVRTRPV